MEVGNHEQIARLAARVRPILPGFALHHVREDVGVPQLIDATTDVIGGYMVEQKAGPFNFNPLLSLPPAGTCILSDHLAADPRLRACPSSYHTCHAIRVAAFQLFRSGRI